MEETRKSELDKLTELGALLGIYDPQQLLDIETLLSSPLPIGNATKDDEQIRK